MFFKIKNWNKGILIKIETGVFNVFNQSYCLKSPSGGVSLPRIFCRVFLEQECGVKKPRRSET